MDGIPALGHFISRRQEKRLLGWVQRELDREGGGSLSQAFEQVSVRAEQSSDRSITRLEIDQAGGATLRLAAHDFERDSMSHYRTLNGRGWGGSASSSTKAWFRPFLSWLSGRSGTVERSPELPFTPDRLSALAGGQENLALQLAHQAWTAWRDHGQPDEVRDGRYRMRASQTPDGGSFQAEIQELGTGQRWKVALDLFSDSSTLYLGQPGHELTAHDIFQPVSSQERGLLKSLWLSGQESSSSARQSLEQIRASLKPGESLEQAVVGYQRLPECNWPEPVRQAIARVEGMVARGIDRSTALDILRTAGTPENLDRLTGLLQSQSACREYVQDPVRWEALRLGQSVKVVGSGVREAEGNIQVGPVRLRKR